ncbi:conserved hypothetical protein [Hyphomicrobiales bacterium]|nr:conserved hypothetical protein [Hyphomicrobiales bacterium]CAH1695262.1 conserved hypothetical protein [Hyphomicrobiales bacterium]
MTLDATTLNTQSFVVHDVDAFPIVRSRSGAIQPGYGAQWQREMDALIAHGEPFVVIFDQGHPEEAHDDRKLRGLWLKRNRERLAAMCKAVLAVEPNAGKRLALKAQAALVSKAFNVPMEIAATPAGAEDLAFAYLGMDTNSG